MKIAIIGAGSVGKTLGAALRAKGHTVFYGSHDPGNTNERNLTRLALGFDTSGAELLQSQARRAKFYKAFNSSGVSVMTKPHFADGNAVMFVAGPGGPDKKTVLRIVADVGFEAIDAGELKAARLLEPLAMLWIKLALLKGQGSDFALVTARRDVANRNADPRVRVVHPHPQEAK